MCIVKPAKKKNEGPKSIPVSLLFIKELDKKEGSKTFMFL